MFKPVTLEISTGSLVPAPNRSLNLTPPRAEFFVRRGYILSPMLIDSEVSLTNGKNVTATAVQNGRRRLAPNRYTVALFFFKCVLPQG